MNSFISFPELLALVGSGVTLHNGLQYLATRLTAVATAVDSGNVKALTHDVTGAVDFVETHDPAVAKRAEIEVEDLKAAAAADIAAARHGAAEEIRQLAELIEKTATAVPAASPTPPASPETPPAV